MKIAQANTDGTWFKQNQLTFIIYNGDSATQPLWSTGTTYFTSTERYQYLEDDNDLSNIIYKEKE